MNIKNINIEYKIDFNSLIDKFHNLLYKNHKDDEIKNYYTLLCEKNKCIDYSIGYSILVTKLENSNMIENKVNNLIIELLEKINLENEEDLYKYILCIFNIIKLKNDNKDMFEEVKNRLDDISKNVNNKKIQFKIMDINDVLN